MEARKVYYRLTGIRAFLFQVIFTVNAIYFVTVAGLNPLQLVLIGTIMEISVLVFEIPTGVIADHFSRKWSIVIGTVILGCAHLLEGSIPLFLSIGAAYAIWGLGYTFFSGAEEAWIADEVQGKDLDKLFLTGSQMASIGKIIGIAASVAISMLFSVQIAIIAAACSFFILALWLAINMPEKHFVKMERTSHSQIQQMASVIICGFQKIKNNVILLSMAGVSIMWGLASEGFDRLWEVHFLEDIQLSASSAIIWFGLINAIALLLNIGLVKWIEVKASATGELRFVWILLIINSILIVSIFLFAISGNLWLALASYWISSSLRGLNAPLYSIWLNQRLESKGRATMLSMFGQLDAFGQIAGGPLVGWIALSISIPAGLITTSLLGVPVIFLLWLAKRKMVGEITSVPMKQISE
ncbi:MFS transporter [Cytobacillus dafuensis]|uniref:MFS transporter n=1 Tax=Cytobacillus dafuensis TaxID=1742359 RepID=A0A5B8Z521_CYTDA|nr:MFS transporter [Cytobacillus dafuensis]QED47967.1 MFS transporter [Cytobacillus dafuensis]